MLVFGIDVPLIEVMLAMLIVIFVVLLETIVILALLTRQTNKIKKLSEAVERISHGLGEVKSSENKILDVLKKKK